MRKKRKNKNLFAEKVKNGAKTILYELLPLPQNLSAEDIDSSFSLFAEMIKTFPVDAINVPEVREETRSGTRQEEEIVKLEPRKVCSHLQKHIDIDFVVNKPIVYHPWQKQKRWVFNTSKSFGIDNIILVGGESSSVQYPGLSVSEAAKEIQKEYPQIVLGGITIPTRHEEARRVLQKSLSGVTFFTSQIIYESSSVKKFLKDYWELCKQKEIQPKMIFLSFAPVAAPRDVNLLQWLGVVIPKDNHKLLTTGWLGMSWRSLKLCQEILEDILEFVERQSIRIPLGLNIEHINRHNLEASFILLEKLSTIYNRPAFAERRMPLYV